MTAGRHAAAPGASLHGIGLMVLGSAALTVSDAIVKHLGGHLPFGEILALRGLLTLLPLAAVMAWRGGGAAFRVVDLRGQVLRAVMTVATIGGFLYSLTMLPLADATAILYAGPLFATVFAVLLLGESVGWRRAVAVGIGFVGVLVMLRPGARVFDWPLLLPLGGAVGLGLLDVLTRHLTRTDSAFTMFFYGSLAMALFGAAALPFAWATPAPLDLLLLVLNGLLAGGGVFLTIGAFRLAGTSVVSPFRYSGLVWAVPIGYAIWHELPDAATLAGAALVVGSGVYIWHRERRRQ